MIHRLRLMLNGRVPFAVKEAYLKLRQIDAGARALPDFLIIGAQKAGTTSLHNYLCQHPRIVGSVPKEIFYFCSHPERGERWYRRHFPRKSWLARHGAICGEATPTYLYSAQAAELVAASNPQARIIVLLREPAARAVSNYHHRFRAGRESKGIDEVFSAEAIARMAAGTPDGETECILYDRSHYARGLREWRPHFPRKQLLVLEAEELFRNPQAVMDRVCSFLELPSYGLSDPMAYNRGRGASDKPRRFDELVAAFAGPNQELLELGIKMNWMRE